MPRATAAVSTRSASSCCSTSATTRDLTVCCRSTSTRSCVSRSATCWASRLREAAALMPRLAVREFALAALALLAAVAALAITAQTRGRYEHRAAARGLVRRARGIEWACRLRPAHGLRRRPPRRHRGSRASDASLRRADLHLLQRRQGADAGGRPRAVRARPPVRADRCARPQARTARRADDSLVVRAQRRLIALVGGRYRGYSAHECSTPFVRCVSM